MRLRLVVFMLATVLCCYLARASLANSCPDNEPTQQVAQARAAFNQAIARAQLSVIEGILSEEVILVTGTDSHVLDGRQAQLEVWRKDFAAGDDRFVYLRTPDCLTLSGMGNMVLERGHWLGRHPSGYEVSGSYSAKWRKRPNASQWRLEAEIFMTDRDSPPES